MHHSARGSSCTQQRIRTALECSIPGSTNAPKCIFLSHCYYIATTFSLCCCCYTSYMLCSTKNITKNNPQKDNNLGPRNCFRQLMYYKFLRDIPVEPVKEWQGVCGGPTFSFLQQFQITSYADVAHEQQCGITNDYPDVVNCRKTQQDTVEILRKGTNQVTFFCYVIAWLNLQSFPQRSIEKWLLKRRKLGEITREEAQMC